MLRALDVVEPHIYYPPCRVHVRDLCCGDAHWVGGRDARGAWGGVLLDVGKDGCGVDGGEWGDDDGEWGDDGGE